MSIFSALVFQTPGERLTRVISVVPPCSTCPIRPYPNFTRAPSEPERRAISLVVEIDENYPIQSVQNPLLIGLRPASRAGMKRNSFGLSCIALLLSNKGLANNAQ